MFQKIKEPFHVELFYDICNQGSKISILLRYEPWKLATENG